MTYNAEVMSICQSIRQISVKTCMGYQHGKSDISFFDVVLVLVLVLVVLHANKTLSALTICSMHTNEYKIIYR